MSIYSCKASLLEICRYEFSTEYLHQQSKEEFPDTCTIKKHGMNSLKNFRDLKHYFIKFSARYYKIFNLTTLNSIIKLMDVLHYVWMVTITHIYIIVVHELYNLLRLSPLTER